MTSMSSDKQRKNVIQNDRTHTTDAANTDNEAIKPNHICSDQF